MGSTRRASSAEGVRGGLGRVLARWDARLLILAEAVLRMVSLSLIAIGAIVGILTPVEYVGLLGVSSLLGLAWRLLLCWLWLGVAVPADGLASLNAIRMASSERAARTRVTLATPASVHSNAHESAASSSLPGTVLLRVSSSLIRSTRLRSTWILAAGESSARPAMYRRPI